MSEQDYLTEKAQMESELRGLCPQALDTGVLDRLADFLRSIPEAWREARPEQRNALGRQIFEEVWIEDRRVVAVKPREEFEPLFRVSFEEWLAEFTMATPMGFRFAPDSSSGEGVAVFPVSAPAELLIQWSGKLEPESWPQVAEECRTRSLREVAKDYGVSHEAVRRAVKSWR